jgi:tight adherence protein B
LALVPRAARPATDEDRITTYTTATSRAAREAKPGKRVAETSEVVASVRSAAAGVLRRNQDLEAKIAARLDAAGSELKPAEWLLIHTAVAVVVTLLGALLTGGNIVVGLLALALGIVGPWLYLGLRKSSRRKAFNKALPDTLQLISGSLAAGLSLQQSIDTVVNDGVEPISGEFRRVLVETRLGVSVEDALEGIVGRFESKDFGWVVMAIRIQRQVGGNLAELLDSVAATMREREYLRRQVSALSAEGRLSALVLGLLPPLFLVYLMVSNWDYVNPLFTDPRGLVILIGGTLWLGVGVFWMNKLVKVDA